MFAECPRLDVKSIEFDFVATVICGFDQRKAAEIALATVRHWLELNHSSVDCPKESSKAISEKVDFNVVRDPNTPLGLINYGE